MDRRTSCASPMLAALSIMTLIVIIISLTAAFSILHFSAYYFEKSKVSPRKTTAIFAILFVTTTVVGQLYPINDELLKLAATFILVFSCALFIYKLRTMNCIAVAGSYIAGNVIITYLLNLAVGAVQNA
jgi:hypothetical protein